MNKIFPAVLSLFFFSALISAQNNKPNLKLNDQGYFETRGLNVLVFNNWYNSNFSDSKISGIELIHHGVRTATNGDVRLEPTPGQWDAISELKDRKIIKKDNCVETYLSYPKFDFNYMIKVQAKGSGILITVNLDKPLPSSLAGKAGLNLEFLPSAYFEKSYLMDNEGGTFPLYPYSEMSAVKPYKLEPKALASGKEIVLAPGDPLNRVTIQAKNCSLSLYDGRNTAQNGWFVVRSLLPSGKTGNVLEWFLTANTIPNWIRKPVIEYSQVGYHPEQRKTAVIEFDVNDNPVGNAELLKINEDGTLAEKFSAPIKEWGKYLRYNYYTFDFSSVKENGLYKIKYDTVITSTFRIDKNVYKNAWKPTLDVYFPVQMDHMFVKEAYRVWHGAAHLDDALQAPVNHEHFDLYAQGPSTDSPYKPYEHIPGLNVGGWFDAGDFDIRTQTQYYVVLNLVNTWEAFHPMRDETTVDEKARYVEIHRPDGTPDIIQQIEHGTLQLLAQFKSVGHAVNGIIVGHLSQYTHLGDASTITDNLIYDSHMDTLQTDGFRSGKFDDRWAFTSKSSALNYGSIAALAAASRALHGYNDSLAAECIVTAKNVWADEQTHAPDLFHHGNTTGGPLDVEKMKAAVELLKSTKEEKYKNAINELLPFIEKQFLLFAPLAVDAMPYMDSGYSSKIKELVLNFKESEDDISKQNPFGVPISTRGWAGDGLVVNFAITNYVLHKAFPDIIDEESVYRGLNYLYGCHPGSNISFVSGVGTVSKKIAYGNNRADFSFIAGGVVPGVLILKPDFPENKEDWPFLWGENEYVVNLASGYIYLVNAVNDLLGMVN